MWDTTVLSSAENTANSIVLQSWWHTNVATFVFSRENLLSHKRGGCHNADIHKVTQVLRVTHFVTRLQQIMWQNKFSKLLSLSSWILHMSTLEIINDKLWQYVVTTLCCNISRFTGIITTFSSFNNFLTVRFTGTFGCSASGAPLAEASLLGWYSIHEYRKT